MNTRTVLGAMLCLAAGATALAADKVAKAEKMVLSDGRFELAVPDSWQRKQPRVNIIEYEYEVPAVTGDARPARVTVMGAGGSIADNVNRWYGQFRQPDESDTSKSAKVEEKEVAGQKVTLVDVSGTYLDKPGGPVAGGPTVERENYRMLAAIIETTKKGKKTGNYFIKLIGPKQTVADSKKAFERTIDSLKEK
ncbi:MAG: hypothetical protein B7Z73_00830 [Planctomycetia bacterium 21-64-5]|nr:MAG: hypothetical protein B7Z73_00830 [Planctomycetia bacterium 21-64-5]